MRVLNSKHRFWTQTYLLNLYIVSRHWRNKDIIMLFIRLLFYPLIFSNTYAHACTYPLLSTRTYIRLHKHTRTCIHTNSQTHKLSRRCCIQNDTINHAYVCAQFWLVLFSGSLVAKYKIIINVFYFPCTN